MESLLYKTPSPVTAKRRLSSIPISRIGLGREQRVASDHIQRIQTDWPELQKERTRRGSMGNTGHFTRQIKDDADSIDSSMGFRELERHIAKIKQQNFDLKLELHIRREKMTENADKVHRAERMIQENEELRVTLRDVQVSLKTREDELSGCKALICLLSDQLEHAHKRIAELADVPKSLSTSDSSSIHSEQISVKETSLMRRSKSIDRSSAGSVISLVSLESSVGRDTDNELQKNVEEGQQSRIATKGPVESIKEIRIPPVLEHVPKMIGRRSVLEDLSGPVKTNNRSPFYNNRCLSHVSIPSTNSPNSIPDLTARTLQSTPKIVTPGTSRRTGGLTEPTLLPTPEETGMFLKPPLQRTLRSRIFRSKSDIHQPVQNQPTDPPEKSVANKNSFIRFFRPKHPSAKESTGLSRKETLDHRISPTKPSAPPAVTNFTEPHESDKLSRYPKMRSVSTGLVHSIIPGASTHSPSPEWRHRIGRQVSEMVKHWEQESSKLNEKKVSCVNATRASSIKDVSMNPLAVRATRDIWAAKAVGTKVEKAVSLRSMERGERKDQLRRQRNESVSKLGLSEGTGVSG